MVTRLAAPLPADDKTAPSADSACMGGKNTDQIAEELENQLKELRDFLIEKNTKSFLILVDGKIFVGNTKGNIAEAKAVIK